MLKKFIICLFLFNCSMIEPSTLNIESTNTSHKLQQFEEDKVKIILADMSFGVEDYYRELEENNAKEAIIRWDNGVRVLNLDSFERKQLLDLGWKVVYKGTNTPILGSSIELSDMKTKPISFNEEQVRIILVELSKGVEIDYYKEQTSMEAFEAVKRWDDGVRVLNQELFERKQVGELGWQIVYTGTLEPISGKVVQLSAVKAFDEARIRYIMVDIELGVEESYYSELNEEEAKEALRRRQAGFVVKNLDSFSKLQLPNLGWKVVYKGTQIPIDGLAVEIVQMS